MSDTFYSVPPVQPPPSPQAPSPRASTALASVLLLLLVFFVGLAVGQSGFLAATRSAPPPVAVGRTPEPGSTSAPRPSAPAGAPADFDLFWDALNTIRENYVGRDEITDEQ